jgi:hypothetical protein
MDMPNKEGAGGEGWVLEACAEVPSPGAVKMDEDWWGGVGADVVVEVVELAAVLLLPGGAPNPRPNAGALAPEPNRGAVLPPKAGVLAAPVLPNSEEEEEAALLKEVPNRPVEPVEAEIGAPPKAGPLILVGMPNPKLLLLGMPPPSDVPPPPKVLPLPEEVGAAVELLLAAKPPNPKDGKAGAEAPVPDCAPNTGCAGDSLLEVGAVEVDPRPVPLVVCSPEAEAGSEVAALAPGARAGVACRLPGAIAAWGHQYKKVSSAGRQGMTM